MTRNTRNGSAGLGILVVLIALAIGLYLMFGKTGGGAGGGVGGGKSYMQTVVDSKKKADHTVTHVYLAEIARMVGMYELTNARYPNSMDELIAFAGEGGAWANDPWGKPYTIAVDAPTKTVRITSAGPDAQLGTADDQTFDQPIPM